MGLIGDLMVNLMVISWLDPWICFSKLFQAFPGGTGDLQRKVDGAEPTSEDLGG